MSWSTEFIGALTSDLINDLRIEDQKEKVDDQKTESVLGKIKRTTNAQEWKTKFQRASRYFIPPLETI